MCAENGTDSCTKAQRQNNILYRPNPNQVRTNPLLYTLTFWPSQDILLGRGFSLQIDHPTWGLRGAKKKNTILYSDLASRWNILEPINGIALNILGNMILYSIWASPRNIPIRIPHVGRSFVPCPPTCNAYTIVILVATAGTPSRQSVTD